VQHPSLLWYGNNCVCKKHWISATSRTLLTGFLLYYNNLTRLRVPSNAPRCTRSGHFRHFQVVVRILQRLEVCHSVLEVKPNFFVKITDMKQHHRHGHVSQIKMYWMLMIWLVHKFIHCFWLYIDCTRNLLNFRVADATYVCGGRFGMKINCDYLPCWSGWKSTYVCTVEKNSLENWRAKKCVIWLCFSKPQ